MTTTDYDPTTPATQDDEFLSTCSDVVKSYNGFRPRGSYLDSFCYDNLGREYTSAEAHQALTDWCEGQSDFDDDGLTEWEERVEAELARTSWMPG